MDVIITGSLSLLKAHLQSNHYDSASYFSFSADERLDGLMKAYGIAPVVPVIRSSGRQETVLHDHIEVIGKLSEWNGHISHWWTTDIASKNVYRSPLLPLLRELITCIDVLLDVQSMGGKMLCIFGVSWPVIIAMRQAAIEGGWRLRVLTLPGSRFMTALRGKVQAWADLAKSALSIVKDIAITNRSFDSTRMPSGYDKPTYLIKSFVYPDSFREDGTFYDPFFGRLAEYLTEELRGKATVMSVVLGFSAKQDCYRRLKDSLPYLVIPVETMLRYTDVAKHLLHLILMVLLKPFGVKGEVRFLQHDITGLLHELLTSGGWRIPFYQYIYYAIGKRLAIDNTVAACAMTHESNPWERAFIAGLKEHSPRTRIIGYQHSVIHLASANMFQSKSELTSLPMPDIVLTTGDIPTNILRRFGAMPGERIKTSCGLRYDYPTYEHRLTKHEFDHRPRIRVLVALCGVIETMGLVRYTMDQAGNLPNIDFLIRPHPVLPFDALELSAMEKKNMPANITVSTGSTVAEDIMRSDLVLYWGSSVSLEGIRLGRPVMHFHQDDILSYDPLFEVTDFKWVIEPQDDIEMVIEEIHSMSDREFEKLQDSARRYVVAYHNLVSNEGLSPFLEF